MPAGKVTAPSQVGMESPMGLATRVRALRVASTMRSGFVSLVGGVAILVLAAGTGSALPVLDQQNVSAGGGSTSFGVFTAVIPGVGTLVTSQTVYQTFTVGIAGLLTQIDVEVGNSTDPTPIEPIDLALTATSGGVPTASLASASLAPPALGETVFRSADLSGAGISVTVGQVLAIRLSSTTSGGYQWFQSGDTYPGGLQFVEHIPPPTVGGDPLTAFPDTDMAFRTFVDPAPVPEPGTLLLLGSGLGSFGAVAWRRHRRQ